MRDGRGKKVEPIHFTNEDRADFIDSFLTDERASDEWREFVKHLLYIVDNGDEDCSCEAEEALLNLEAMFAYETDAFHGNEYFSETYWENYRRGFANA